MNSSTVKAELSANASTIFSAQSALAALKKMVDSNVAALQLQRIWRGSVGRKEASRVQLIRERNKIKSKQQSRKQKGSNNTWSDKIQTMETPSTSLISSDSLINPGPLPHSANPIQGNRMEKPILEFIDDDPDIIVYKAVKKSNRIKMANILSPSRVKTSLEWTKQLTDASDLNIEGNEAWSQHTDLKDHANQRTKKKALHHENSLDTPKEASRNFFQDSLEVPLRTKGNQHTSRETYVPPIAVDTDNDVDSLEDPDAERIYDSLGRCTWTTKSSLSVLVSQRTSKTEQQYLNYHRF